MESPCHRIHSGARLRKPQFGRNHPLRSTGGNSGGVAEAVQDGVSGLLADPHSAEDIALKMETLLSNPAYAKQLGQSGLTRLRTRFHWDGYVRRAYALLMGEELP